MAQHLTIGAMHIFSLGTYDGTEMVSTDGTSDGKFEVLLIDASLVSLDGIEVVYTEGTELWLSDGIVIGTTLGIYDGTELGLS